MKAVRAEHGRRNWSKVGPKLLAKAQHPERRAKIAKGGQTDVTHMRKHDERSQRVSATIGVGDDRPRLRQHIQARNLVVDGIHRIVALT